MNRQNAALTLVYCWENGFQVPLIIQTELVPRRHGLRKGCRSGNAAVFIASGVPGPQRPLPQSPRRARSGHRGWEGSPARSWQQRRGSAGPGVPRRPRAWRSLPLSQEWLSRGAACRDALGTPLRRGAPGWDPYLLRKRSSSYDCRNCEKSHWGC